MRANPAEQQQRPWNSPSPLGVSEEHGRSGQVYREGISPQRLQKQLREFLIRGM
ncbi:hypothetical protein e1004f01.tmp0005 [Eimeria tenella]|uniref:Uncharacterized protein n=1 Tax=Eimeria tenella TaxID=5802 RepID=C8TE14_EIMTE|nr:hypothetical protein e1004f01.tmp0005 [Eimeria tenella]